MFLRRFGRRSTAPLALVAALFAAGCTSAPTDLVDPANRATGSTTIVWTSSPTLRNASDDERYVLVDAFEQANPSIKVRVEPGSDSTDRLRKKLKGELSSGSVTPDVYSGDVIWPAEFGHDGLALPLNRYLPQSFWNRYDSVLVQAMTYQHEIYAAPYFVDKGFLYYRADLLKRAGLTPPRTWEELESDALVLKSRALPYQFAWQGDSYEGLTCDWMEFMADAFNGLPPNTGIAQQLASPQALRALRFMRTLIQSGISPPDTNSNEEAQTDKLFDGGQVAFLRSWDSSYANALGSGSRIADPGDVGVELPPTFQDETGPGFSAFGGWSLFVNPHSRNPDAALTFVKWMTGVQAQRILATQFSSIPANVQVLGQFTTRNPSSGPVLSIAANAKLVDRPSQSPNYAHVVSSAIYTNINKVLFESPGVDPCRALIDAAHAIDPTARGTLTCSGSSSVGGRP